ncbi:hypothetical protein H4R35_001529 [Dimargaris xerosporica]|nr:hypothetical protein H4R35_001529 [Dimargaris xerosporica]
MSGGVDSSTVAYLLKQQGYDVEGVYMRNWDTLDEYGVCPSEQDYQDVQRVCTHLGIPCRQYWNEVFSHTLDAYAQGLWSKAEWPPCCSFRTDAKKDQSYYLSALNQNQLQHILFPLGNMTKAQVKAIAHDAGLVTADKKESMGICFVGKRRHFAQFLAEYITESPGNIVNPQGRLIVGQRIPIAGSAHKWFVYAKDTQTNTIRAASGSHPLLFSIAIRANAPSWIRPLPFNLCQGRLLDAQVRSQQRPVRCHVQLRADNTLWVQFAVPIRAVAPGQP